MNHRPPAHYRNRIVTSKPRTEAHVTLRTRQLPRYRRHRQFRQAIFRNTYGGSGRWQGQAHLYVVRSVPGPVHTRVQGEGYTLKAGDSKPIVTQANCGKVMNLNRENRKRHTS